MLPGQLLQLGSYSLLLIAYHLLLDEKLLLTALLVGQLVLASS
jgi:hypothetical protein